MILGRIEGGNCTCRTLTTDNAPKIFILKPIMVGVAQLVEHRVVAPVVEGSSPFTHPILVCKRP